MTNGVGCFLFPQARYSPQNFTDNIRKALDILHAEVQRPAHVASEQPDLGSPWASGLAWGRLWLLAGTSLSGPLYLETSMTTLSALVPAA